MDTPLYLNTAAAKPHQKLRVHIGELLRYRATVAATTVCCDDSAKQAAVTSAAVSLKENWKEEYQWAELDAAMAAGRGPRMVASRADASSCQPA